MPGESAVKTLQLGDIRKAMGPNKSAKRKKVAEKLNVPDALLDTVLKPFVDNGQLHVTGHCVSLTQAGCR